MPADVHQATEAGTEAAIQAMNLGFLSGLSSTDRVAKDTGGLSTTWRTTSVATVVAVALTVTSALVAVPVASRLLCRPAQKAVLLRQVGEEEAVVEDWLVEDSGEELTE